jgi:hypothetical protein
MTERTSRREQRRLDECSGDLDMYLAALDAEHARRAKCCRLWSGAAASLLAGCGSFLAVIGFRHHSGWLLTAGMVLIGAGAFLLGCWIVTGDVALALLWRWLRAS